LTQTISWKNTHCKFKSVS